MFVLCLSTMLWPWFGDARGVQEIYGTIMLDNPIALTCIILVFMGIWIENDYSQVFGNIGLIGIIAMQIYEFMTWHIYTISGHFDLGLSFSLCYPEFYYALLSMVMVYIIYKLSYKSGETA